MNSFRNIIINSKKNIAIGINYPDEAMSNKNIKIRCLKYSGDALPFSDHNQASKLNSLYFLSDRTLHTFQPIIIAHVVRAVLEKLFVNM